jgi:hypothetical protein
MEGEYVMPKRILLLAATYVAAFFGLAGLMLVDVELSADDSYYVSDLAYLLLFLGYMTVAGPLGLWGALGKSPIAVRVAACILPALAFASWMAVSPTLVLMRDLVFSAATEYELQELFGSAVLSDMIFWAVVNGALLFLLFITPTALAGAFGWFANRRGLQIARLGEYGGVACVTRYSLRQLLLLMFGVSALLAVQPILALGTQSPYEELSTTESDEMLIERTEKLEALLSTGATVVDYDFDLDDDYVEPSAFETVVQSACYGVSFGTPFLLASFIGIWVALFADSPWRRLIWGAPMAALTGGLFLFHDAETGSAMVVLTVFFACQMAVLWIVRTTGYRLVWHTATEKSEPEAPWQMKGLEPAIA